MRRSAGGKIEGKDQGSSFLERVGTGEAAPGICKDEHEQASGQGTPTLETNIRESHKGTADQTTRKDSQQLGCGKHEAQTVQEV